MRSLTGPWDRDARRPAVFLSKPGSLPGATPGAESDPAPDPMRDTEPDSALDPMPDTEPDPTLDPIPDTESNPMPDAPTPPSNLYPSLTYDDAPAAIDFLCRAFGFTQRLVVPGPDGTVMHSELSLGPGVIMVSSPKPSAGRVGRRGLSGTCQGLCVQVDDPDAHCARATAAGAEVVDPLRDEDYGSRGYMAKDPEGQLWYFGTYRPGAHWTAG